MNAHEIDYKNIDRVQIGSFTRTSESFCDSAPSTDIDAQLSMEYVSVAPLSGREWYSPSLMTSPTVAGLMKKIEIELDPVAQQAFWERSLSVFGHHSDKSWSTLQRDREIRAVKLEKTFE
ncbi:MmgE/PrpD family protein [Bradyrhizobium sp. LMTR 3]|uniref:MmgE/PrpD family protein n=1 Tax=Bradyrhizobium sp. LMTR 3 TaxID=189873 RepID=UPI0008105C96|nr:MmgE/PrpD family protein [Bradyrhizobium sp. LMTR 3]